MLRRLGGPDCDVTLVLSPFMTRDLVKEVLREHKDPGVVYSCLREIQEAGIRVHPGSLRLVDDLFIELKEPAKAHRALISLFGPVIPAYLGMSRSISRYLHNYLKDLGTYDLVYSHHECLDTAMLVQRISAEYRLPFIILLHNEPYFPVRRMLKIRHFSSLDDVAALIPALNLYFSSWFMYRKIITSPRFRRFLVISPAPLEVSGLSFTPHTVLNPANAISVSLHPAPEIKRPEKGNYALFASRFSEDKGIFELPYIWMAIHKQLPDMKLFVYGNSSEETFNKFQDLIHGLSLDDSVSVRGYLPDETEFYNAVSRARVLIHPSHSDGFSMIILESLALGTPVAAYDLPAFTYYYKNFHAVEMVREWDRAALSHIAVRIMNNEEVYAGYLNAPALLEFIRHHSSWKTVARNEREVLMSV